MLLSDVVSSDSPTYDRGRTTVARSINIERDLGDAATLKQYIVTDKGLEIIRRFKAALSGDKVSAWSLTGPYGMGKSAFVNFFVSLCGDPRNLSTKAAAEMLKAASPQLFDKFKRQLEKTNYDKTGFLIIAATASFEPINRTLARALQHSLAGIADRGKNKKNIILLQKGIESFLRAGTTDTATLLNFIKKAGKLYGAPVVIAIDEFGKNLEYMAQHSGKGDLFILQSLAESNNIFTWVCLHQAFEEYASSLSKKQIQEWGKIQGRFEDISFTEPRRQMIKFVASTLKQVNGSSSFGTLVKAWSSEFSKLFSALKLPKKQTIDQATIANCYPLHPLVTFVLPDLCNRFAQNDRTLFSFLCGGDPCALPNFLRHQQIDVKNGKLATFKPASLYDYFLAVTNSISMNRPESKRWFEVNSIIEETRHFPDVQRDVLKVIGLLNLLAKPTGLRASKAIITFACFCPLGTTSLNSSEISVILDRLVEKGLLIYREYADEYRLWEGTDIDIVESLKEYRARLAGLPLDEMLDSIAPLAPIIASRHSYKNGTLRHFERRWLSVDNLKNEISCGDQNADGLLIQCFGDSPTPKAPPAKTDDDKPIVLSYATCETKLRDAIIEAAATANMLAESPELARDGVARKEARYRAQMAENKLRALLEFQYSPANSSLIWFVAGKSHSVSSHKILSNLISNVCDATYRDCPVIRNELINRDKLSSATAKARREVIDAMVSNGTEAMLAMTGTGPEVAIYRTMLLGNQLHQQVEEDWQFSAPAKGSSYFRAWATLEKMIQETDAGELLLSDIVHLLQRPPIGMKYGPIPILMCLFLLVKTDELALYREGRFLSSLSCEEMELMVKRPELFSIKRFMPTGLRREIFNVYRKLLNTSPVTGEKKIRNNSMVSVVGPLVQFAANLSDYVKQTRTISKQAQAVRRVLLSAKDPIVLLFADLPKALCGGAFSDTKKVKSNQVNGFQIALRGALVELTRADQLLRQEISENLLAAFAFDAEPEKLREELRDRALPLLPRCADKTLKPFLTVLTKKIGNTDDWLISVATIVNQRPVDSWRDTDLQVFTARIHDFARRLIALETVVTAELSLPAKTKNKDVRFISMMDATGNMPGKVLRVNKKSIDSMRATLRELDASLNHEELEALLMLLGEKLLTAVTPGQEEIDDKQ